MDDFDANKPITLDIPTVITIHDEILKATGGIQGLSGEIFRWKVL